MSMIQNAGRATIVLAVDQAKLGPGLDKAQQKFQRFASSVTDMSAKLSMIGAIASMPMAAAVRAFAGFDDQMRMVAAVTGAAGNEFGALTERAKELGRATSFTAKEVATGMLALGRMGFKPTEILAAIDDVMNLARATGTELGEAATIASNNLRVFGMEASQMTDVADVLTVTANASAQTLTDLGEALKTAGPQAARFGETLLDTSTALGVLANMGIRGSMAGTALSRSFVQMTDPKVVATLANVGVQTTDATGNLRKMKDILGDVAVAMSGMGTAEAGSFIRDVFNMRGALGGGVLVSNIEQIQKMNAALEEFSGTAKATSDAADAGLGGSLRLLKSASEGAALALGQVLGSAFLPAINGFTSLALATEKVAAKVGWLIKPLVRIAGLIVGAGVAFKAWGVSVWAVKTLAAPVLGLAAGMAKLKASFMAASASAYAMSRPIAALTIAEHGAIVAGRRYVATNYAMAASQRVAATAAYGLGVAMNFLSANAFMILITAVAASVAWAANEMHKLEERFKSLVEEAKKAEADAQEGTHSTMAENRSAYGKFNRLQQIAEMVKLRELTDDEIKQAESLTDQLKAYGSETFAFTNAAARSFSMATDAAETFGNAVRNNAVASLEEESKALEKHISILTKRQVGLLQKLSGGAGVASLWGRDKAAEEHDNLITQLEELKKRRLALWARIKAMRKATAEQASGTSAEETLQQQISTTAAEIENLKKTATDAATEIEKLFDAEVRSGKSAVENETADIELLEKKYKDLAKTRRDFILAQARYSYLSGDTDATAARMAEVNALDAQTAAFTRMTAARRRAIETASAKGFAGFIEDEESKIKKRVSVEAGEDAIGGLIEARRFDKLAHFMDTLTGSVDSLKDVYRDTLQAALDPSGEGGAAVTDTEKEALEEIQRLVGDAMNRVAEYQQRIDAAREGTAAAEKTSSGTYYVDRFFSKIGTEQGEAAKRTAQATENTERKLADLYYWLTNKTGPLVIGGGR